MVAHDVVITGIGLITSLGEGVEAHKEALFSSQPKPVIDTERFAPYHIHPCPEIDWSQQISKRDQRQMELWQKLGVYASGLALDDAGVKDDEAICSTMDMIIAAGGGERDVTVDGQILDRVKAGEDKSTVINDVLTTELRPTLFLAQLSNLLAGNISIVHKVTGSSRTFMGEELAGLSALQTSAARIRSGQSTHALVGGSINGEHADVLLSYQLGGYLNENGKDGVVTGSFGAFFVLESREHAEARGAEIYASIDAVDLSRTKRDDNFVKTLSEKFSAATGNADLVINAHSGAQGAKAATDKALSDNANIHTLTELLGHAREAQPFVSAAIAAMALKNNQAPVRLNTGEAAIDNDINRAAVTVTGFHRGEGTVVLTRGQN